jgi:tRNA(Arg) A34 adenosine deaminase TadA
MYVQEEINKDIYFLKMAIELANEARRKGEDPFGAVLVYGNQVVGSSVDRTIEYSDPSAHAKLVVVSEYCRKYKIIYLTGYTVSHR